MSSSVDWSYLADAYGPATEIPALLRQLRTAPAQSSFKDEPWFSLWSALCHQGDVYTASFAALPELAGIAADREPEVAIECLYLAALIELERHSPRAPAIPLGLRDAYERGLKDVKALAGRLPAAGLRKDHRDMLAIVRAVAGGQLTEARRLVDAD